MNHVGFRIVQGINVEVWASTEGKWEVRDNGEVLGKGDTLEKAIANARNTLNKQRILVNVPFITREGLKLYGQTINLKTSSPVAVDGELTKFDFTRNERVFKPDIPKKTIDKYIANLAAIRVARDENKEIEREWDMNLSTAIDQAIEVVERIRSSFEGLEPSDHFNMAKNLIAGGADIDLVFEQASLTAIQKTTLKRASPKQTIAQMRRRR